VVKVTTIREGSEFEDLDYPDEDEGIEKLVDAKWTFILWPCKDIIVKTHSSPIVSPWSKEARGAPTSNMPKPTQNHEDPELQESTGRRLPSPVAQDSQGSKLRDSKGRRSPSLATRDSQGLELQDNNERRPPTHAA
jgi:hypothetical protein